MQVIQPSSALINKGHGYEVSGYTSIPSGSSFVFLGITSVIDVHLYDVLLTTSNAPIVIELIENPIIVDYGINSESFNKNRNSKPKSLTNVYTGATINGGDIISVRQIVETQGQSQVRNAGIIGEWVLKNNTPYAIKITNNYNNIVNISASFTFFESLL